MSLEDYLMLLAEDKLIYFALPVFLISMLVEMYINHHEHLNLYKLKDTGTSIITMFLSAMVEFVPKLMAFIAFVYLHEMSPLKGVVGRQWWAWMILLLMDDFIYYWFHRLNHEVRIFWAGHVPHHSSVYLNFGTALRQGVGERVHKFLFWMILPLLGFDPLMIFTAMSINLTYQFFVHTELIKKLPDWVEFLFNTPSHHRVHHASNIRYLDCNHAGVLIIWDRLFGTFSEERDFEKPIYGLTENINSYNPVVVATHEYSAIWRDVKRAKNWSDKLKYIFYAPGWSHDGQDKRAKRFVRKWLLCRSK